MEGRLVAMYGSMLEKSEILKKRINGASSISNGTFGFSNNRDHMYFKLCDVWGVNGYCDMAY